MPKLPDKLKTALLDCIVKVRSFEADLMICKACQGTGLSSRKTHCYPCGGEGKVKSQPKPNGGE